MHSPYSPTKVGQRKFTRVVKQDESIGSLLTPPEVVPSGSSNISIQSCLTPSSTIGSSSTSSHPSSPNHHTYYKANLSKAQFNSILVNCATNLLKILYTTSHYGQVKFVERDTRLFIIEILRRSKTSIHSLQLTCYYIYKLINLRRVSYHFSSMIDSKKMFLVLLIIASKFNQDHNYSLKSWCKICGVDSESSKNLHQLRDMEITVLSQLNYELVLSGDKYENWCNVLLIFAYDFIKSQFIKTGPTAIGNCNNVAQLTTISSEIVWDLDTSSNAAKIVKWYKFFKDLNMSSLNLVKISFSSFFSSQKGSKIFAVSSSSSPPSPLPSSSPSSSSPPSSSSSSQSSVFISTDTNQAVLESRKRCMEQANIDLSHIPKKVRA